jgi:hypothetical protein
MEHEHQNPYAGIKWHEEAVYDALSNLPIVGITTPRITISWKNSANSKSGFDVGSRFDYGVRV